MIGALLAGVTAGGVAVAVMGRPADDGAASTVGPPRGTRSAPPAPSATGDDPGPLPTATGPDTTAPGTDPADGAREQGKGDGGGPEHGVPADVAELCREYDQLHGPKKDLVRERLHAATEGDTGGGPGGGTGGGTGGDETVEDTCARVRAPGAEPRSDGASDGTSGEASEGGAPTPVSTPSLVGTGGALPEG